jgi:hypothetical protein
LTFSFSAVTPREYQEADAGARDAPSIPVVPGQSAIPVKSAIPVRGLNQSPAEAELSAANASVKTNRMRNFHREDVNAAKKFLTTDRTDAHGYSLCAFAPLRENFREISHSGLIR